MGEEGGGRSREKESEKRENKTPGERREGGERRGRAKSEQPLISCLFEK